MLGIFTKRPIDQLDYDIDFSRWLPDGDTLMEAAANVESCGSMVTIPYINIQPQTVKVWVVDGVIGKTASVYVTATTAQSRRKQVEFQIRVRR